MDEDKKGPNENTAPIEEEERAFPVPRWNTGFVARFPWLGFWALVGVLMCLASCVVVLKVSDGRYQSQWPEKIAPNVIISGLNSISNLCFSVAIANGVAIAWWRKTLRGSTIRDLHRSWNFSTSFKDIVLGSKYFNFIALAALTAKLTIIDGMLLQRATKGVPDQYIKENVKITGFANTTIPVTAHFMQGTGDIAYLEDWLMADVDSWSQTGGYFPNTFQNCSGMCLPNIPGAGFEFDCTMNETSVDYGKSAYDAANSTTNSTSPYSLFDVNFDVDYRDGINDPDDGIHYSRIIMNINYVALDTNQTIGQDPPSCPGTLKQRTCYLRPAIVAYPLFIDDETSKIRDYVPPNYMALYTSYQVGQLNSTYGWYDYAPEYKQEQYFNITGYEDILEDPLANSTDRTSRLGGIKEVLTHFLSGNGTLSYNTTNGFSLATSGMGDTKLQHAPAGNQECGFEYSDPIQYLVSQINTLMFVIALDPYGSNPDNNRSAITHYKTYAIKDTVAYYTESAYMWGAVASTLVCILCVLPSYYGFWQLGRRVTLGPFEIANALQAPILDHPDTANAKIKHLIRGIGDREVKYGEVVDDDAAGRLALSVPHRVRRVHPSIGSAREEIRLHMAEVRQDMRQNVDRVRQEMNERVNRVLNQV